MDAKQFSQNYVMTQKDYFPAEKLHLVESKLSTLPEDRQIMVQALALKNPIVVLILSLVFGGLAVDRFYLGDIGLGILKLVSVFLIIGLVWALLDIYFCYKKAKEINFNKVMSVA